MFRSRRLVLAVLLAFVAAAVVGTVVAQGKSNGHHGKGHHHKRHHGKKTHGFPPNIDHFNLNGYTLLTDYTLGRNTGSAFKQDYTDTMVQGTPVKGPFVGSTFPPAKYTAIQIAPKTLYVVWQDGSNNIIDAFVMNFQTHTVFDYAPDTANPPESAGTVRILKRGPQKIH